MKKYLVLFLLLFLFTAIINSQAQNYSTKNIDVSTLVEELFPFQDQDLNYSDLYENIVQLLSNPIDINKASPEELRFLHILSEIQIQNLINHRADNGDLISIYELQTIPEYDIQTIKKIAPFIRINDQSQYINQSLVKRVLTEDNNYFLTRYERNLELKKGFDREVTDAQKFKGSPDKLYFRFRTSNPGDFSFGFTAEKDAGEYLSWNTKNNQYLFDYLSFHLQVQNKGKIKNLIIGDFQNQFGQGLTLGGAFAMGKGSETITSIRRSNVGSLPYTSINESGYLSGLTLTQEVKRNVYLTTFVSRTKPDATIVEEASGQSTISSFTISGLHRNAGELEKRKSCIELDYGAVINYKNKSLDAGLIYNNTEFNLPVIKKLLPYNQYAFTGRQNQNTGAFINYSLQNFLLFGELSKSIHYGNGFVFGVLNSLTPKLDVSLLYRNYDKNFYSFHNNAFSENTSPQNESGMYWGWKYRHTNKITLSGYFDYFQFPWLRFRSYSPSMGHEWLSRITYQLTKTNQLYIQYREEKKARNDNDSTNLYHVSDGLKHNFWIGANYSMDRKLSMKTRAQFSSFKIDDKQTQGMAIMQDVSLDLGRFDITTRYALFDTDDYDNRQYCYEQDVWLAYSLPAYYGKGSRYFVLIQFNLAKKISLWLRFSRTQYIDRKTISSGMDAINGSSLSDIKFQLRLQL
ncbi:MAG TPA: helix-hairpin-helix domain-containing protein [Cyclobacteriaceae bacterium]|nr:helix-hairpin-helix domain-containing protein [Cyclobacteriaceae bacterium]